VKGNRNLSTHYVMRLEPEISSGCEDAHNPDITKV